MSAGDRSHAESRVGDMVVVEHEITVPLDHADPSAGESVLFAREVWDARRSGLPWLLYLHGGPCHENHRPTFSPVSPEWLGRALQDYRVVFLDARGTGRSEPILTPDGRPEEDAHRLTLLRADSI